ncbi:MAG: SIMPL domain-containing protein [Pirellulales bacterium]
MKRIAFGGNCWFVLLCTSLVGLSGMNARADDGPGITVTGSGVAEAMPDTVELTATVEGNAELAGDAVEKYRSSKRRVVESLDGLKIAGVKIVGAGVSVNSGTAVNFMAALQGGEAKPKAADKVAVQEKMTVTLGGVGMMSADELLQTLTRVVDVIKDAGVVIGGGPQGMLQVQLNGAKPAALATFKLSNADSVRQQAYEAALKQARAKAEGLAKLAGVQLGDVVAIRETASAVGDDSGQGGIAAYMGLFGGQSSSQPAESSPEFRPIPISVSLSVQFAIVKK